jgi:dTMP kinase
MSETTPGSYIVIEGTDGAGTTTQKELLMDHILEAGQDVIAVAEPGGTAIGKALRLIFKDAAIERDPSTNVALTTICRRELLRQVIEPTIEEGTNVISDRNWFSTVAYQGFGESYDVDEIVEASVKALGRFAMPNYAVIIDVPTDVAKERILARGESGGDYFEQKGRTFFDNVRAGYRWVAQEYKIPVIDGTQSIEEVHAEIKTIVLPLLG